MTWIQTTSGNYFDYRKPELTQINLVDIESSLARQCRYLGHLKRTIEFYSIAEHSCYVAWAVCKLGGTPNEILWALLHDATEAYIGDIPRPLKEHIPFFTEFEASIMDLIAKRFGLQGQMPKIVKKLDYAILELEKKQLLERSIRPWPPMDHFPCDFRLRSLPPKQIQKIYHYLLRAARAGELTNDLFAHHLGEKK